MPDDPTPPSIEIRWYEPADEPRAMELFETCFERSLSVEEWRWRYGNAVPPTDLRVLTVDGEVMGFMGRVAFNAWVDGRRTLFSRPGDLMIDPAIRGTSLSSELGDRKYATWVDLRYSFPSPGPVRARAKIGRPIAMHGDLPQWVRWQSGQAVHLDATWIPKAAGAIGAAALRVPSVVAGARRGRAVVDVDRASLDQWAPALDDLAAASREFATVIAIRDASHLRWRWLDRPGPAWHMTVVPTPDTSGIDGFVVYAARDGQGRIVDVLARDAAAMQSLVLAAIDRLARDGVERVLFDLADPRAWAAPVLRRCGFLPRGRPTEMRLVPEAEWLSDEARELRNWYVTLADTDHD